MTCCNICDFCGGQGKLILCYSPGVSYRLKIPLLDTEGNSLDLTNCLVVMHLRTSKDSDSYFEISVAAGNLIMPSDLATGIITVELSTIETASIYRLFVSGVHDLQVKNDFTDEVFVRVVSGTFKPFKTVTRIDAIGEIQVNS